MRETDMLKATLCALALTAAFAVQAAPAMKIMGPHASLDCAVCHANGTFKTPAKETCLTCHQSYEAVAKRTEKMNPNPHFSHRGQPNCSNCHSMHAKPRFECNDCHTFDVKMKGE